MGDLDINILFSLCAVRAANKLTNNHEILTFKSTFQNYTTNNKHNNDNTISIDIILNNITYININKRLITDNEKC